MTRQEFYHSKTWQRFRQAVISQRLLDKGEVICDHCGKPIMQKYDMTLHHIEDIDDITCNDASIALNPDNILIVHHQCHNAMHQRFGKYEQRVYLVYGPPCAGKSTYVRKVAGANDLIVDMNALHEAINKTKSRGTTHTAVRLRNLLIDDITRITGSWQNAYIVGGYPVAAERERLIRDTGAIPIFLDITEDEALSRTTDEEKRKIIKKWYRQYTE